MAPLKILIVGCGVAGPTLASFLLMNPNQPASEKPHITILERSPNMRAQGQNIDVRGAGVTVIRKLGLETAIRAATTGEIGAKFVDSYNRAWASFGVDKSGKVQTGTSDIEILRGRLAELCWKRNVAISEEVQRQEGGKGVEYVFGDFLSEVEQDEKKVTVVFANSGAKRQFDLVVGADGLQSKTRRMVWGTLGEDERVHHLGMYGAFFSMPRCETDSEWRRWYHAPGRRGIMVRPSDSKERMTAFVSVINTDDHRFFDVAKNGHKAGEVKEQMALLAEYFEGAGWESERIVKQMEQADDFYYDMVAQIRMDKWSKGRVVLLGDAG